MFYVLSKLFWVVAQPLGVILALLLLGILLTTFGRRRLGMTANIMALVVLALCAFSSLGFLIIRPLEDRFVRPAEMPATVDAIVVLGGSTHARVSTARGTSELNEAGDRLTEAVVLARRYPEARLVFSGGAGILEQGEAEAATAERFFLAMGIAPERLVLEGESRNTDENAELTAGMIGEIDGPVVLVTSAFHMPRSVGLFRRVGIEVVPWPTDYRSSGREGFGLDVANPAHNVNTTSIAIKEWIGLAVYHWTGRIAEFLPAQSSN
ncbi:YdcF family protein [Devosia sp. SL43]|uniref:YdcF family protein n=1 Tax=Devosia sp. SL43 TaxID=2806348 RepID=UPI001F2000D8|nr:YdcF family protein [Devosia sp. SL43]UJW87124.1 YdcF family protein [Devosia sp. SL43]